MHFYNIEVALKLLNIFGCNPEHKGSRKQLVWFCMVCCGLCLDTYLKVMLLLLSNNSVGDFIQNCYNMLTNVYVSR